MDLVEGELVVDPICGPCHIDSVGGLLGIGSKRGFVRLRPTCAAPEVKIPAAMLPARGVRKMLSRMEMLRLLSEPPEHFHLLPESPPQRYLRWLSYLSDAKPGCRKRIICEARELKKRKIQLTPLEQELVKKLEASLTEEVRICLGISATQAQQLVAHQIACGCVAS